MFISETLFFVQTICTTWLKEQIRSSNEGDG